VIASKLFGSGKDKPDPGIFIEGLRRVQARAAETLFVGDNPFRDIEGARGWGWRRPGCRTAANGPRSSTRPTTA